MKVNELVKQEGRANLLWIDREDLRHLAEIRPEKLLRDDCIVLISIGEHSLPMAYHLVRRWNLLPP